MKKGLVIIAKYRLKKDLPMLSKGVIFEHRQYDFNHPDRGNPGCGCMILGWLDGNCQGDSKHKWCGETYVFPGQLADDEEWFEPLTESLKEKLIKELENLRAKIDAYL